MKIRYSQLKKIVVEEMQNLGLLPALSESDKTDLKSVEDVEAKEIEPGDEGQLEKDVDHLKALKIKEAKLLRALGETRFQMTRSAKRTK